MGRNFEILIYLVFSEVHFFSATFMEPLFNKVMAACPGGKEFVLSYKRRTFSKLALNGIVPSMYHELQ